MGVTFKARRGATVHHTPIEIKTIAKNGSEKFGANAECKFWIGDGEPKIELTQYGNTKQEAFDRLMNFLSNNGKNKVECIDLIKSDI